MKTYVNADDLNDLARGTDCYYQIRGIIENENAEKVKIVECKDCIYSMKSRVTVPSDAYTWCDAMQVDVPDNWFCASGTDGLNYDLVV